MEFQEIYLGIGEREEEFLIEFLFQLTIFGREIHMEFDQQRAVIACKQLNEINHRILNRVRDINSENAWCEQKYVVSMVANHIGNAPFIKGYINSYAKRALGKLSA